MPNDKVLNGYHDRFSKYTRQAAALKKQQVLISFLRLVSFASFIIVFVFLVKQFTVIKLIAALLLLVGFIMLIVYSIRLSERALYFSKLILINEQEINALHGNFSFFNDGSGFVNRDHPFSYDLDIFGERSLYQFINRSFSAVGQKFLAFNMKNLPESKDEIMARQEAVKELAPMLDWRQAITATGYTLTTDKNDPQKIDEWIDGPVYFLNNIFYRVSVVLFPILTILSIVLYIIGISSMSWALLLAVMQLSFAGMLFRKTNKQQRLVSDEVNLLKNYLKLIRQIEQIDFRSANLKKLREGLQVDGAGAQDALKKLVKIIDAFDTRLNIILGVILNATLMWDLYSLLRLEKWRSKYGNKIKNWTGAIASFDYYCSMANYSYNHPGFIFPGISSEYVLEAVEMGHPLIPEKKRVDNSIAIKQFGEITIITGANMAGKSTFLRAVGVNLVLAMNGVPVVAKKFNFSMFNLFSGMRTTDSLKENESYFYAELKRLKYIVDHIKQGKKTFVLLDEILKGTNSADKAEGSWKFVEYMAGLKAAGIVATHDLGLCLLEEKYPQNIKNKCFEVDINGDKIKFDYKLKDGVTQNMNATILMKQMKIFPDN